MVNLTVINRQGDLPLNLSDIADAVDALLRSHRTSARELTVHFLERGEIAELHGRHFGDHAPTDCMGFPLVDRGKLIGDICICPGLAIDFAQEHPVDPHREVLRYLAHSLLHFLGFCDGRALERERMTKEENRALELFSRLGLTLAPR